MIEKPSILITGLGRTGTQFFSRLFEQILPDATSLHEPDVLPTFHVGNLATQFLALLRRASFWRAVVLKLAGAWTLRGLSDSRFLGKLSVDEATRRLRAPRADFVAAQPGSIYVEAHNGYCGLLDITPNVFQHHKAMFIVRDGREWVRSVINYRDLYGKPSLRRIFVHKWPTAAEVPGDPYATEWSHLSQFARCCWAWSRLNEYALTTLTKNPNARLYVFERIFSGKDRYPYLEGLLQFATALTGVDASQIGKSEGWLERKINASPSTSVQGEEWTSEQKRQFAQICGPLMEKLGYDL